MAAILPFEYLRDRIVAADPGLHRLRTGLRAALTAALAAALLPRAAMSFGEPATVGMIGIFIGMLGTFATTDPTPREQQKTMLLLPLAGTAAVALAAFAAPQFWLSTLVFLAVSFLAVFARRYGARGMALGMAGFMSYFIALYFGARFAELPWIAAGMVLAIAIAFAVKFGLVRERPEAVAARRLRAFRAQVEVVLDELEAFVAGARLQAWRRARLRRSIAALNENALTLEQSAPALQEAILEIELAVETVADVFGRALRADTPAPKRARLAALARALHRLVRTGATQARREAESELGALADFRRAATDLDSWRLGRAIHGLARARPWALEIPAATKLQAPAAPMAFAAPRTAEPTTRLSPNLRLALQATLAAAIAIAAGRLVSPTRWYWAVIVAFMVFARATTIGETFARAWQALLGTILGVAGGLAIAHVVGSDRDVALALIFVGIFGMYYFLQRSYGWAMMFITMVLALLYRVLGRFDPDVLYLRLEEVAVGAVVGTLVSMLVLPSRSGEKVRALAASALRAACAPVGQATEATAPRGNRAALQASMRELDRHVQGLRQAAAPLAVVGIAPAPRALAQVAHQVEFLAYCVRHLVPLHWGRADAAVAGLVREIGAHLVRSLEAVADALEARRAASITSASALIERLRAMEGPAQPARLAGWLDRVDQVVVALGEVRDRRDLD